MNNCARNNIFRNSQMVESKDSIHFSMLFTLGASLFKLRPHRSGKPENFRSFVCQGFAVDHGSLSRIEDAGLHP